MIKNISKNGKSNIFPSIPTSANFTFKRTNQKQDQVIFPLFPKKIIEFIFHVPVVIHPGQKPFVLNVNLEQLLYPLNLFEW